MYRIKGMATGLILCAVDVRWPDSARRGPRVVLDVRCIHHTDEVAPSPRMLVVTPRCDAVVDVFSSIHCWAGGPPPADVGHSPTNYWSSGQSSGCVSSGRLRVV